MPIDCHLHSSFSFDSEQDLEDYLRLSDGLVVTTEHFDLSNPYTKQDDIPDYVAYSEEIECLNQRYDNRLRKGIEIGYYQPRTADILAYLEEKTFDLKLLSVHHNGHYDYLQEDVFKESRQDVVADYLHRLIEAVDTVEADDLAHFDYGFRKLGLSVEDLVLFDHLLLSLFHKMADKGMAFELNTKSIYLYGNQHLYEHAISLLKTIDDVKYSIGTDGHCLDHYQLHFAQLDDWLERMGIDEQDIFILR